MKRVAGLLCPLFSLRSRTAPGIGEIPDLSRIAPWLAEARLRALMILPIHEGVPGQESPYCSLSAFAIDPIYVGLEDAGVALTADERAKLAKAGASPTVDWAAVRPIKMAALRRAFARDGGPNTAVTAEVEGFRSRHESWLNDYALFRAIKEQDPSGWRAWDAAIGSRDPAAMAEARKKLANDVAFFEWVQLLALRQLASARRTLAKHGVALAGDLPFLVGEDSADVWSRQQEFLPDATVGAPPDAFSAEGQDWGLPAYRWDEIAKGGYAWFRERGRHAAELFDWVRVDHVVGLYRTWVRSRGGAARFVPDQEHVQREQGEAVLGALRSSGATLVAEDLGVIPPFVRESLVQLGIPGYRVLRWESEHGVFRDPAAWPALSVATSGTHDTEPMATWWDELPDAERDAVCALPRLAAIPGDERRTFGPAVHAALLETLYASGSDLLVTPIQDLLGARERINLPGTMSDDNWRYRLPFAIEELGTDAGLRERTVELARLASAHGR